MGVLFLPRLSEGDVLQSPLQVVDDGKLIRADDSNRIRGNRVGSKEGWRLTQHISTPFHPGVIAFLAHPVGKSTLVE